MPNNPDKKNWTIKAISKGVGIGLGILVVLLFLFGLGMSYVPALRHTEYAPKYSHSKFKQVKVGILEQEVLALIGEPLERMPDTRCRLLKSGGEECTVVSLKSTWYYSQQDETDTDYFVRSLEIENGKVARVVKSIYFD